MRASWWLFAVGAVVPALGLAVGLWSASEAPTGPARPAVTAKCAAGSLAAWINYDSEKTALRTIFYHLEFTNVSGHECFMDGYPGVSAVTADDTQVGSMAVRLPATKRVVNVAPAATVHATLYYVNAVTHRPRYCTAPVPTTLIRVNPPGQATDTEGFDSLPSCTGKVVYLRIGVIQPGL
jgi:hypothetical protein